MKSDDLTYLLACVKVHADKFPVPSHILSLANRITEEYKGDIYPLEMPLYPLNKDENKAIVSTVQLWNDLCQLTVEHEDDINDFRFHIHAIQDKILARPARREL